MNIQQLMKQAQEMQAKMQEAQAEVANIEVTGQSGGGMVQITVNGKHIAKSVSIDESLMNVDEKDVLEDLIVAAINDASKKLEEETGNKMSGAMGDMPLPPGLKLPF